MAVIRMDAQELATVAWFLESAIVSLKENLEEAEEEGVEDAVRARDLYELEGLRETLQAGLREGTEDDGGRSVDLEPRQLARLGRLAGDAAALCRGEKTDADLGAMGIPPEAGALAATLAAVRDRARAHPQFPDDEE